MLSKNQIHSMYIVSLLFIALFGVSCCSCFFEPKVWVTEEQAMTFPASGIDTLDVATHNGEITLFADSNAQEIAVTIRKKAGGHDEVSASGYLDEIEIIDTTEGTTQKLGWKWMNSETFGMNNRQARVSFEIRCPAALRTIAETHNGSVTMTGMQGEARLKTHNGSLKVMEHIGDLAMVTHNGTIRANASTSKIDLVSHNGTIKAELNADRLEGRVKTYNGSIRLGLQGRSSTRFTCRTHNGSITPGDLNVVSRSKHYLEAVSGEGAGSLDLETHNGSITLE